MTEQTNITKTCLPGATYLYGVTQAEVDAIKQGSNMHKYEESLSEFFGYKTRADMELADALLSELTKDAEKLGMYTNLDSNPPEPFLAKMPVPKLSTLAGDLGLLILTLQDKAWKVEQFQDVTEMLELLTQAKTKLNKLKGTNE